MTETRKKAIIQSAKKGSTETGSFVFGSSDGLLYSHTLFTAGQGSKTLESTSDGTNGKCSWECNWEDNIMGIAEQTKKKSSSKDEVEQEGG